MFWKKRDDDRRGRRLIPPHEAQRIAKRRFKKEPVAAWWGGVPLKRDDLCVGQLATGGSGSGKSITLERLILDCLSWLEWNDDARALMFDMKTNLVSFLQANGCKAPIVILHPFDKRSVGLDLRDYAGPVFSKQFAALFIRDENTNNPYFEKAAKAIYSGVIQSLAATTKGPLYLADTILACDSKESIEQVLRNHPATEHVANLYLAESKGTNTAGVLSTLANSLGVIRPVAAIWRKSPTFSLSEFVRSRQVVLLGNDTAREECIKPINQAIFLRATQLFSALPDSTTRTNWTFIDELPHAGRLSGLRALLGFGRSRGCITALGILDFESLKDRELYGPEKAASIVGLCANVAVLRQSCEDTAEKLSKFFGDYEANETKDTRGGGSGGPNWSQSEQVERRRLVMPAELMGLPPCTPDNGLFGYYSSAAVGPDVWGLNLGVSCWPARVSDEWREAYPDFIERPASDAELQPYWTEEDRQRLGLPLTPPDTAPPPSPTPPPKGPAPTPSDDDRGATLARLRVRLNELKEKAREVA